MGYRQDLEAALQRVTALERELDQAAADVRGSELVLQLTAERDALARELAALQRQAGETPSNDSLFEQARELS